MDDEQLNKNRKKWETKQSQSTRMASKRLVRKLDIGIILDKTQDMILQEEKGECTASLSSCAYVYVINLIASAFQKKL